MDIRFVIGLTSLALSAALLGCSAPVQQDDTAETATAGADVSQHASAPAGTVADPLVTVYKSPTCGCCTEWVEHMQANGFRVEVRDTVDVAPVKQRHGLPMSLASCHTALVDGYVVEGHVPAEVIRRLLRERPEVTGIAVPGMPTGSPGMEGPYRDRYDVISFDGSGELRVYSSH